MQKQLILLSALFLTIFISACGGGSDSKKASAIYDAPTTTVPVPADGQMGGAVQELIFAARFSNYSVSTFAGTAGAAGSTAGDLSTARFNKPVGIATDGTYLYIADTANNRIRRINIITQAVENLAGSGLAGYVDSIDNTGATAAFNAPSAITVTGDYLYVADTGNNMIRRVHKVTGKTNRYAGSSTGEAGAVDHRTVPDDVRFYEPTGITTDGENLYVADSGNHTIRRIVIASAPASTAGAVTTLAGSPGAPGNADGDLAADRTSSAARFNQPARLTTDGTYLYVTDALNRTIRRIAITTGTVVTIAGVSGPIDANGNIADADSGDKARFYQPNGITTDGSNLYVTDSYNNTVRMIKSPAGGVTSGPVTTLIPGTVATPGSSNGSGSAAKFDTPIGITTDGSALYVTDSHNHTVRKIESR